MPAKIKVTPGYRWCPKCGKELPIEMFYNSLNSRGATYCKVHHAESNQPSRDRYVVKMREKRGGYLSRPGYYDTNRRTKIVETLTDESNMPEGISPYDKMKMSDIPAWYLIKMYEGNKCDKRIKLYVQNNMEVLKAEL